MMTVKYVVHSDINENNIYNEFDTAEEAIEYAQDNIAENTYVEAIEVELSDFGEVINEFDHEIIWSYADDNLTEHFGHCERDGQCKMIQKSDDLIDLLADEFGIEDSYNQVSIPPEAGAAAASLNSEDCYDPHFCKVYYYNEMLQKNPNLSLDEIKKVVDDDTKTNEEKSDLICEDATYCEWPDYNEEICEDTHASKPQPKVEVDKAHAEAQELANKTRKEVIYGYYGPNHHGETRYFKLDNFIVCDDLQKEVRNLKLKYGNKADSNNISVLTAYPDLFECSKKSGTEKDIMEAATSEMQKHINIADKFRKQLNNQNSITDTLDEAVTEIDEDYEDMSDFELAEELEAALKEKHCNK